MLSLLASAFIYLPLSLAQFFNHFKMFAVISSCYSHRRPLVNLTTKWRSDLLVFLEVSAVSFAMSSGRMRNVTGSDKDSQHYRLSKTEGDNDKNKPLNASHGIPFFLFHFNKSVLRKSKRSLQDPWSSCNEDHMCLQRLVFMSKFLLL